VGEAALNPKVYVIPAKAEREARDLVPEMFDAEDRLRIMPASYYRTTTGTERALVCVKRGLYGLPTTELCEWLKAFIGGRSALEIGAGNGSMAAHLGIRACDNYMLEWPEVKRVFQATAQLTAPYGANVERLEALAAVQKYRPQVVIGSWITHRYNPRDPWRGGNQYGPDLPAILKLCEHYVLIGNEETHGANPLWALPHTVEFPPWLFSRTDSIGRDFVAVWKGGQDGNA
jgi:hypothetical protein